MESGYKKRDRCNNPNNLRYQQCWFYGHGPNGEMIIEDNQHEVARVFGLNNKNISACLSGKEKTHKGWKFRRV
jgi:hypothetical protein